MKGLFAVAIFLAFSNLISSTDMIYHPCGDKDIYRNLGCTINRVAIEGCGTGPNVNKMCNVKRGRTASITVDFIPDFDSDHANMTIYSMGVLEKAWPNMDTNACNYMTCPVKSGVETAYTYGVKVEPVYPTGKFQVRFVMAVDNQPKCCFITKIQVDK